jgi:hypothetical protein
MASKLRNSRETQKAYWVEKLNKRVEQLTGQGIDAKKIEKDTVVRQLKAKVRESSFRLVAIDGMTKKLVDMEKLREEKKAAPPKIKGKKAEAAPVEESKTKKKKKEGGEKKKAEAPAA